MATDLATSVQGLAMRITPLDANDNFILTKPPAVPGDTPVAVIPETYVTNKFLTLSFTPEYEEGDEITEKNADGSICVQYKAKDSLKKVTISLSICAPEPELYHTLAGGTILTGDVGQTTDSTVGWAAPVVGATPSNAVCIEVWSRAVTGGRQAAVNPFWHWLFPVVKLRMSGDRALENGLMANGFEGDAAGSADFGTTLSKFGDAAWQFSTASPYQYARVPSLPTVTDDFTPAWVPTP